MSSDYTLAYGTHASPNDGRCAMEWVSYLAGEPHSDQPVCVSPVLRSMCIALNDGLDQEPRQRLRPYLTRTIGTANDGLDAARAPTRARPTFGAILQDLRAVVVCDHAASSDASAATCLPLTR